MMSFTAHKLDCLFKMTRGLFRVASKCVSINWFVQCTSLVLILKCKGSVRLVL